MSTMNSLDNALCRSCRHVKRCTEGSLACQALVLFKTSGASVERCTAAPRQPTAALFARLHAPATSQSTTKAAKAAKRKHQLQLREQAMQDAQEWVGGDGSVNVAQSESTAPAAAGAASPNTVAPAAPILKPRYVTRDHALSIIPADFNSASSVRAEQERMGDMLGLRFDPHTQKFQPVKGAAKPAANKPAKRNANPHEFK